MVRGLFQALLDKFVHHPTGGQTGPTEFGPPSGGRGRPGVKPPGGGVAFFLLASLRKRPDVARRSETSSAPKLRIPRPCRGRQHHQKNRDPRQSVDEHRQPDKLEQSFHAFLCGAITPAVGCPSKVLEIVRPGDFVAFGGRPSSCCRRGLGRTSFARVRRPSRGTPEERPRGRCSTALRRVS